MCIFPYQKKVCNDRVLECNIGDGVDGRDGAGLDVVEVVQHLVPQVLDEDQVGRVDPLTGICCSFRLIFLEGEYNFFKGSNKHY